MKKTYTGSCHCGAVRYKVVTQPDAFRLVFDESKIKRQLVAKNSHLAQRTFG